MDIFIDGIPVKINPSLETYEQIHILYVYIVKSNAIQNVYKPKLQGLRVIILQCTNTGMASKKIRVHPDMNMSVLKYVVRWISSSSSKQP